VGTKAHDLRQRLLIETERDEDEMEMRVYATLRDLLGGSRFYQQVSDGATIKDVLERLVAEKPGAERQTVGREP